MSETLLSARDLSVGYHGRPLLREICLQVHPGEILTLIGPNGAGKSTILNSLIGQLRLLGGQVSLLGRDIVRLSEREIARSLSVMMTGRAQPDRMTCWEVAAAGRYPYTGRLGILGPGDRAAVRAALERVRALELRDAPFDQISDGQRQRVLLARALCAARKVILLDEPAAGLDPEGRDMILGQIREYHKQTGSTIVLVSHSMEDIAKYADRVLVMNAGRIAMYDATDKVFARAPELLELGLSVPEVTKIFLRLREMGLDIDTDVYTVKYAVKTILAARAAAKEGM